ncbi:LemA family protein [Chitinophaga lutea]|uniref:LemA family protein n=1 Tax=Chitinophaga lutea TaxID=2488634 RepID=A0A3N4PUD1_9BACT|nr:LemA family protein [Chitinophaga lutea]RPE08641.1 LemA family protein [Chitinophaga lutea]
MGITTIVILAVVAIAALWAVSLYNRLINRRNLVKEAWSGIDVSLKKRYDLIPNLVETVKGYAAHEKNTLEEVTRYRTASMQASTPHDKIQAEGNLTRALGSLFAVAENYPDLKASTNFVELQNELSAIENNLESARRYYNGTVRENNNLVESFPSNIIAGMFGFRTSEFFEIDNAAHRERPDVSFQ